jgi:hypothetical protein
VGYSTGAGRKKDEADPGPGYASFGGPGIMPTGDLGGWAPGAMPRPLPEGIGKLLRKGSDLVLQIHYQPVGKRKTDQSSVGVYFTKKPARSIVAGSPSAAAILTFRREQDAGTLPPKARPCR